MHLLVAGQRELKRFSGRTIQLAVPAPHAERGQSQFLVPRGTADYLVVGGRAIW